MKRLYNYFLCICLFFLFVLLSPHVGYAQTSKWLPSDSVFARYLQSEGYRIINNNELTLLPSGREKFNHLFAEVKKAKHHVHLE